jgi:hypothetical protein
MSGIVWKLGHPPLSQKGNRLLLIASPIGGTHDAEADNRPDICIGHFHEGEGYYVPARFPAMPEGARPKLLVHYWAEIKLPVDVGLRSLGDGDLKG